MHVPREVNDKHSAMKQAMGIGCQCLQDICFQFQMAFIGMYYIQLD